MGSRTSALRAWALAMLALVVALVVGSGSAAAQGTTRRIAGPDRYSTMEALVREGFQSSGWAVVATAEGFPDALAASPVAGARQAPLILTASSQLSPQARSLVSSLGVRNALIMGGEGAVSAEVEATLSSLGVSCERIAGADRAQTSVAAYDATRAAGSVSDTVIVTTGANYADALAIGPWAWRSASPILLAGASGTLGDEAVAKVKEDALVKRVILVGGTSVVSDAVRGQLGDAYEYVRLAGADRYLTAAEVARWSCGNGLSWSNVAVATGTGFADALAAAPTLGRSATPLLLASDASCSLIREKASAIDTCLLLGGTAAVSDAQERAVADALAGTSKGSSATTNTGGARTESDSGWYYSGSSYSSGKYAGEIYGPGYVEPQPQPQPQPEPEPADDDGYEGDTTPEARDGFYLWPDEEDVLIPGGNVSAIVRTTSYERPNDPIYAQAEEADMPVARTEQTFYLEAPKGTVAPTLHVRNADGTERALGQMMPVSDQEVKALNDEYAGNTAEDTGDEYIVLLDPKAHSYWKYTLSPLPTDERTVAYVARTDTLVSNVTEVDYWLPFTTDEISVLEQVDAAIDAMQDDESYWQQSADRRKQTALALIESLAAKGLIEGDSWAFNEEDGVWTFIYNQDRNEDDADGIVGTIETQIVSEYDEYSDGGVDELMPYSEDLVAGEAAPDGIAAMSEPLVAQATTISRKKVLLLNAFPAFEKKVDERAERYAYYRKLATDWRKKGINVTLWERNITVETFAHINTFDCVIIATHGARYKYWTGPRNNRKLAERSGYCVRQQRRDRAYAKALKDGQMVKAGNGYWILSKFFNARYKAGAFSSVVLGSESCSNFGRFGKIDTELPSAFIFKGATAAVGFHNTLASGYGRTFLTTFFEGMFEGKTVSSSMGAAMSKVGSTQKVWWARVIKKPYTYKQDCYPRFVGKQYGKLIS